jgi:hypothetical protein
MITLALLGVLAGIVILIGNLFPESEPGDIATRAAEGIGTVMGWISGFQSWLPFSVLAQCALVIVSVYLLGFGIKLVRIIASFVSGGGGGAA